MALTDVKSEQIQSSVALAGSPTTTTQSASDNSTKIATTAYVETAVANLVASAPSALNTLDELAAALNDDASFSTTITNSIAAKLPLAGGTMSGPLNMGSQNITNAGTLNGITTTQSVSGNRWGVLPEVASNGVLEIGRYLDFHTTDRDTSDYGARFDYDGSKMILTSAMQIEGATTLNSNATVNGDVSVFGANRKVNIGESGAGGTFGFIGWNDASNYLFLGNSYNSAFNTDIVISSTGKVGIGTSSPTSAANVLLTVGNTNLSYAGMSFLAGNNAEEWRLYSSFNSSNEAIFGVYRSASSNYPFIVHENSNVGIGTSSPASWTKLHIKRSSGGNPNTANQALYIEAPEQTAGQGVSLRMSAASGSKEAVGIIGVVNNASGNAGSMTFHTYNLGATIPEYMRLTNQGYLGIGETNPVAKLTLKGANDTNFEVQPDLTSGVNRITNFNRVNSTYKTFRVDALLHQFYVSGNPKVQINSSGIMTQESLPAFNAYYNGNLYTPNNNVIFAHDTTRFDNGNNFNTTYHRFTAPVAGVYSFEFRTIIYGNGNNGHLGFRKNGSQIVGANAHYTHNAGNVWNVFSMHTIQDMAANDYIDVYNHSRTVTYYHGGTWNEFSGYLVG